MLALRKLKKHKQGYRKVLLTVREPGIVVDKLQYKQK